LLFNEVPLACVSAMQARQAIVAAIEKPLPECERPFILSTPNLNFLVQSHKNPAFLESLLQSHLVVADGTPVVWLARLAGLNVPHRVSGSSLFQNLWKTPALVDRPIKVYLFGGEPGAAKAAFDSINAAYESGAKGMVAVGWKDPGQGSVEALSQAEWINKINESGADFLLVALGAAKGQAWLMNNREALTVPVASHLGAVINFVSGRVARAPRLLQAMGLEWLWRIKEEPHLWRRYLLDGFWLPVLLALALSQRLMSFMGPHR
jgi:N-acetylglucosaminyldiphosphoundecaprenol N-acetyl-beta-D-mannosaminyltransferase